MSVCVWWELPENVGEFYYRNHTDAEKVELRSYYQRLGTPPPVTSGTRVEDLFSDS